MRTTLTLALLLAACATTAIEPGFIDYTKLQPNPDAPGGQRWISPEAGNYDRVIVAPVVAYFHPNVLGRAVDADRLDRLLTQLRGFVIDALAEDTLLATEPGPGVLRLEVAVTDLFEKGVLGDANVEARATDSVSGERLAAAMFRVQLGDENWDAVRDAARRWASRVADGLDAARDG